MNDETKVGVAGQDQSAPVKESTPETPAAGRAVPRHERAGRYVESSVSGETKGSKELRTFEFGCGWGALNAVLETDYQARKIRLKFAFGMNQSLSEAKGKVEKIARDITAPFNGLRQRFSDFRHGYKPLVSFSRPYMEPHNALFIVDVELDRTADMQQTIRMLVESLVDHKDNLDHTYTYQNQQYGRNRKVMDPHHWHEEDIKESQRMQREDETPEQHKARLRANEFDDSAVKPGSTREEVGFDDDLEIIDENTIYPQQRRAARLGIRRNISAQR